MLDSVKTLDGAGRTRHSVGKRSRSFTLLWIAEEPRLDIQHGLLLKKITWNKHFDRSNN